MSDQFISYLQSQLDKKLPFLALKKAGENVITILSQTDQKWHKVAPDNMAYAVFSKFYNNDNQVYIYGHRRYNFKLNDIPLSIDKSMETVPEDGFDEYKILFEKAKIQLRQQSLKKVVLSRKQEFPKKQNDLDIFTNLLNTYPTANCYFFYHPLVGKWMGATPELLLDIDNHKIKTMSLAGTAKNQNNKIHIWGEKEKEEQQLVTDFIKSSFEDMDVYDINVGDVQTIVAGHLLHLQTKLSGKIKKNQVATVLATLHPTPAVCGLPRDAAMNFIKENENYDRSFYTGYLGMVDGLSHNYYVNLRCMQLFDDKVIIYVGGGVTEKSELELEYLETVAKLQTMYKLL